MERVAQRKVGEVTSHFSLFTFHFSRLYVTMLKGNGVCLQSLSVLGAKWLRGNSLKAVSERWGEYAKMQGVYP